MRAGVIDGKAIAADLRERVADTVAARVAAGGRAPGLATVLVGDDPASHVYVANKRKACEQAGISSFHHELPTDVDQSELERLVSELDANREVDGILVQMPLPGGLDSDRVLARISAAKDVDGLTPVNAGLLAQGRIGVAEALRLEPVPTSPAVGMVPCTPAGVIEMLDRSGVDPAGAEAVIVGRSLLVGRPLASLLLGAHATVTVCHSRTRELGEVCARADILVAAVGSPRMIRGEWVKPGATVIDVGINRTDDGLVGDVDFEPARERAGLITPVPGGVGPMTIAMLLANTVRSTAELELGAPR